MYLKFVRQNQPCGKYCRGALYSVHFQPNEKGGYNEHLTHICDAYEIPCEPKSSIGGAYPPPLIFSVGVRRVNGHLRLAFGTADRHSLLHLINHDAREAFFSTILSSLRDHRDCRIEVCEE